MADTAKAKEWMRDHASHLFMAGMALLLVLRFVLPGLVPPPDVEVPAIKTTTLVPTLTPESVDYMKVKNLIEQRPGFDQTPFSVLANFNMFDPQQARNAEQITQAANQEFVKAQAEYKRAEEALKGGNAAQAEQMFLNASKLAEGALARQPSHQPSQKLQEDVAAQVNAIRNPKPAEPPAEGQPETPAEAPPPA